MAEDYSHARDHVELQRMLDDHLASHHTDPAHTHGIDGAELARALREIAAEEAEHVGDTEGEVKEEEAEHVEELEEIAEEVEAPVAHTTEPETAPHREHDLYRKLW
jgi:hypothetical protein